MQPNFDSRAFLKGQIKPCKVGIFGSRTLNDERVEAIILERLNELKATKIITAGEPDGVCEVARQMAKKYAYPLELHYLNDQYLQGMFEQRCKEVIEEVDYLIFVHDGKSRGTYNELVLYKKTGKPYYYYKLDVLSFNDNDDYEIPAPLDLTTVTEY